jgi:hypothetical protein
MTDENICRLAAAMAQILDRHTLEDIVIRDEIAFWKKQGHPVDWEFAWRAQFGDSDS